VFVTKQVAMLGGTKRLLEGAPRSPCRSPKDDRRGRGLFLTNAIQPLTKGNW
jgi:hypothetical protein